MKLLLRLPPKELRVNSRLELGIMPSKLGTTDNQEQLKEFNRDTLLTEGAGLEEMTDLESKVEVEETSVTSETNSERKNTKSPLNKA